MTPATRFHRGGWLLATFLCLSLAACGSGSNGAPGLPGASTGTLTGQVTNAMSGAPLAGAPVTLTPAVAGVNPVTDATGHYTATLPVGSYGLACAPTGFTAGADSVSVLAAGTTTCNLDLMPTAHVTVKITGAPTGPAPGASFALTATPTIYDGSTVSGYSWSQTGTGATATITAPTAATTDVTLAAIAAYKTALVGSIEQLERWRVVPLNPEVADLGAAVDLQCTVTTTSGTYKATAAVAAKLPFVAWTTGLQNVPVGVPVLLGGKTQASYDWTIQAAPGTSTATLSDATTRYPWFVPDVTGKYTLAVTDLATSTTVNLDVYAGKWVGGIDGMDAAGNPTMSCTMSCHSGIFPEKFTDWAKTGHASIFKDNLNTSDHYSSSCFACHTVGFDLDATNDGLDDTPQYADFYAGMFPGGHMTMDMGNWAKVLSTWPTVAQKGNIQCENCHGPNGQGSSHMGNDVYRVSMASDVCGSCHGEPPRHGRFQQWENSAHGNYEVAIAEGTNKSCAKCHSAQGFLDWLPDGVVDAAPTADTVHPITCVVCHDPHNVGTVSGDANDAHMRVEDNAMNLESGFSATNVGKGAMCMECHNGRRGLRNDVTGLDSPDRAPHQGPQTDVLFGQNMFFVSTPSRGPHGFLKDTCVTCHVQMSPPPADYSLSGAGANHGFTADVSICSNCHGAFDGGTLEKQFETSIEDLKLTIESKLADEIQSLVGAGYRIALTGSTLDEATPLAATIDSTSVVGGLEFAESHGRQGMNIQIGGSWIYHVQLHGGTTILDPLDLPMGSLYLNGLFAGNPEVVLAKAGWNFSMLEADRSKSFHNPGFVSDVFTHTLGALSGASFALP